MGTDHDNHFAWTRGDKAVSVYVESSGIDSVHSRWILWPLPVVSNIELFAFAGEQQSIGIKRICQLVALPSQLPVRLFHM